MNLYSDLDCRIRHVVDAGRKAFVICPFGANGILTKQILNWRYGIDEKYIIDNGLAAINPNILSLTDIGGIDTSELIVLLNTTKSDVNKKLKDDLLRYFDEEKIINIMEPEIYMAPEKEELFKKIKELTATKKCTASCGFTRIGRDYDGGYVMLNDFSDKQTAYSFGICDDVSWDKHMASRDIHIYMYDHTINGLPEENQHFHYNKLGISGNDRPDELLLSMKTLLKLNNDENNNKLILKMDVEGAEWEFLLNTPSEVLAQFQQMTFEFHSMTNTGMADSIIAALMKINLTHQAIWVHGNNYGFAQRAGDILMPVSLEITYVRKADYSFEDCSMYYPTELDMPNSREISDFILGNW